MDAILSVTNLSAWYGNNEVLQDITFSAEEGDYIGLAGPNGAGKTSLVKAVLGLMDRYTGTIRLLGKDIKEFRNWGSIGYLPQRVTAFNPLFPATVREIVGLGLLSQKRFPKYFARRDGEKIERVMDLMGISEIDDKPIGELSGGQQQRVFLARSLVSDPDLLILDEPSTALDPSPRESFLELLKELNSGTGITIILITHDTSQIGKYANKLLYLDKKVIFYGGFADFCRSDEMSRYFGHFSQHLICHQHD
jgi:zinc transport system ATP-binding protein